MNDVLKILLPVLLGGGFIGGIVALLKFRPEAGAVTVQSAERVVLIQAGAIERFEAALLKAEAKLDVVEEELAACLAMKDLFEERIEALEKLNGVRREET